MSLLTPHRTLRPRSLQRQRGSTLILFTFLTTLVLIPLIGLAIDGAAVFWAKAKLSSAVDAAAIAAGRSINVTLAQGQNSPTAVTAAQEWFAANFPSGWLGTTVVNGGPTVNFAATTSSTQQVSVSASAVVPLYFLRVLQINSYTVSATAQSSRRNMNLVLVLDRSGSMGPNVSNACPTMIADAQQFVNHWTDGFDTIGLVTFSTTANWNSSTGAIDYTPTTHFKTNTPSLSTVLGQIQCTGATSSAQALWVAYQSIKHTNLQSAVNAIVFFTDGQPNAIVEDTNINPGQPWPIKSQSDTRYDALSTGSLVSTNASSCNSSDVLNGVITTLLASGQSPGTTGYTGGIYDASSWVPVTAAPGSISAPGCAFTNSNYGAYCRAEPILCMRQDIASIPNTDAYRNATNSGYKGTPALYPTSNTHYQNQIRVDEQVPGIMAAAFNAADNQANTIRNDTTYKPVIFTIGLDGAPDMPIDSVFLERVANDPRSPIYSGSQAAGYYAYAANPSALNQAFDQVYSYALRLSR